MAETSKCAPVQMLDLELTEPLTALPRASALDGTPYTAARILVRCHTRPIGILDVELPRDGVTGAELAGRIDAELGAELRAHMEADGLPLKPLDRDGLGRHPDPACLKPRRALLANAPSVTVIIPTRGRPGLVVKAVAAVLLSEYPAGRFRVIVVDNAPTDTHTYNAVTTTFVDEPRVSYLRCNTPGSAAARNAGIDSAESEFVAMVDDDVIVDRHWLAELMVALRADDSIVCATGAILPLEIETEAQLLMERFGGFHKGFAPRLWTLGQPPDDDPLFPYTAGRFGSGNNVGYRRSSIRDIGAYDPVLGNGTPAHAGEDFELFLRIVRSGRVLTYQPAALVWHLHRRERANLEKVVGDYGMAITAVLTRTILSDPRAAVEIARRIPPGLIYLLSARSPKNANHGIDYPARLRAAELLGVLRGPFGYLKSRHAAQERSAS